jgi:hypothetical protein
VLGSEWLQHEPRRRQFGRDFEPRRHERPVPSHEGKISEEEENARSVNRWALRLHT